MQAEVISIGDEMTSGQRLDTNSQWLSERLGELGIRVMFHTTVADDLDANVQVFRLAAQRADLVISTGGLGPTADDLTRDALAKVADVDLVLDAAVLEHLTNLFARRKRAMPERNRVQALFPVGSRIIPNPHGTAPGIDLDLRQPDGRMARIFALPGVPAEMKEMWTQTVAPAITGEGRVIRHRRIKCFGVGESDLEAMLPDLIRRGRVPQVGITVSGATITLRITAEGETPEAAYAAMSPTAQTIYESLGNLVFGEEDDELEHAVTRLLTDRNRSLATVEWGTGGMIAHWMSEVPEARGRYLGGLVIPTRTSLTNLLGVPAEVVEQHGVISEEVVRQMAERVRERTDADYGLAVSEFPEYSSDLPRPLSFYYAVATPEGVRSQGSTFGGHPSILNILSAKRTLNLLRLHLLGQ